MPKITLESGIPVPDSPYNRYPFRGMQIGDSFFVFTRPGQTVAQLRRAVYAATRVPIRRMFQFEVRADLTCGRPGVRCWRVA